MTRMIHKPVQERHARRNRYVAVVGLFRKKFGCTARQCLGICETILAENTRLEAQVQEYRKRGKEQGSEIVELRAERDRLKNALDELKDNVATGAPIDCERLDILIAHP